MLSGNIRIMQYFYLSVKVGKEDSSNITGQKLFAIMQTANMVENKQCQLGLIILLTKLVQFIFSFHIFFPAWKQLEFSQAQLVSPLLFFMADSILF